MKKLKQLSLAYRRLLALRDANKLIAKLQITLTSKREEIDRLERMAHRDIIVRMPTPARPPERVRH